jgi:hypothetical protein
MTPSLYTLIFHTNYLVGGDSGGVPPEPIPNSEVKPSNADGTAGVTLWESRSLPAILLNL